MVKQSKIPPILNLLADPKTIDEICQATGRSYPAVWTDCSSLVKDGFLMKVDTERADSRGAKFAYVAAYIIASK